MSSELLAIEDLTAAYVADHGPDVRAVDSVSLDLRQGDVLGVVGESGCGKTTLASVLVIRAHQPRLSPREAYERVAARLDQLALPRRVLAAYPHELSGGMRQRVVAAISTVLNPRVLIADEPTSALDVSSQRALVDMLRDLLERQVIGGIIFISHDLPLLSNVATRVAVTYAGQIVEAVVEQGPTDEILFNPTHPYTQRLMADVPKLPA